MQRLFGELFLLEYMWEKMVWYIARRVTSPSNTTLFPLLFFAILCVVDSMDPDGSQEVIDMGVYSLVYS